jgi:origin recognition complex subunit 1
MHYPLTTFEVASGVPGTGKTATVKTALRVLKSDSESGKLPKFRVCEINGMKVAHPNRAFIEFSRQMDGEKRSFQGAKKVLGEYFDSKDPKKSMIAWFPF